MAIVGLDHVQVCAPADGEARARAFYGELLELPELVKPPVLAARGGAWFALGEHQQLHVGVEGNFAAARRAHPALALDSVAAVEELAARLERHGHAVRWDEELPATRRFYTDDPFGNRLEVLARMPLPR
jgi:catechol 2,3-dioxygenase-like lactoylglutathione lyase family enzyme